MTTAVKYIDLQSLHKNSQQSESWKKLKPFKRLSHTVIILSANDKLDAVPGNNFSREKMI